jgi:N-acetylneuraminic acid mutarotase
LNPVEGQWKRKWEYIASDKNPDRRAAHSMVVVKDKLVIFGGIGDNDEDEDIEYNDSWMVGYFLFIPASSL